MTLLQRLRAAAQSGDDTSMWMLPYSALMLILMIFFAALYGFSQMSSVEYEMALADIENVNQDGAKLSPSQKEVNLALSLKKYIDENNLSNEAELNMSAQSIKLTLSSPVLFESGKAILKKDALPILEQLARYQGEIGNPIVVEGHTDNVPIHGERFSSNWELSAARAFSVIRFLIGRGIAPERLAAHGYGEYRPLFSNQTEQGRGKNRRVEITIMRGDYRL